MDKNYWEKIGMVLLGCVISMTVFFATSYTDFVTKAEVPLYAPYPTDRETIIKHITVSEAVLLKLNEKLDKELRALDMRLTRLETRGERGGQ